MIRKTWLLALAAMLAMTLGCRKEEAPQTTPAAPAMEEPATPPAPEPAMEQTREVTPQAPAVETQAALEPAPADGPAIYEKTCAACHGAGVSGAPKVGDKAAWAGLQEEGVDHLTQVAIQGEGGMPPRGGNPELSDEEVHAAVAYMLEQSR